MSKTQAILSPCRPSIGGSLEFLQWVALGPISLAGFLVLTARHEAESELAFDSDPLNCCSYACQWFIRTNCS